MILIESKGHTPSGLPSNPRRVGYNNSIPSGWAEQPDFYRVLVLGMFHP